MQSIADPTGTEPELKSGTGMDKPPEHTPNRTNRIIMLAAALILLNALYNNSLASKQVNDLLEVGDNFSEFSLETLNHGTVDLERFLGKPSMFFFYADWCPCSHQSIGWIKKARADYGGAGLDVMGIGIQDKVANLERFAKGYKLKFPVVVEGGQSLAGRVGVKTTPTTFFVDADGVIQSIYVGKIEKYDQIAEGLGSIIPQAADLASGEKT